MTSQKLQTVIDQVPGCSGGSEAGQGPGLLSGTPSWEAVDPHLAPEVSAPVFLVGMNGSGTTMLLDSLIRHPELFGFKRETRLLPHMLNQIEQLGDLLSDQVYLKAWKLVQSIPAFAVVHGGTAPPIPDNWQAFRRDPAAIVDAFFRYFATSAGKQRWCEKSPQNVQHIEMLAKAFPGAKFVHVIRDGRACAASFHRRWGRHPELSIYRWRHAVAEGQRQGNAVEASRYLEVRYEELTQQPEEGMRRICEFLGVPFDVHVLESRQPQSRQPNAAGKIRANPNSWRQYFNPKRLRSLESIAGSYLLDLGYEVSDAADDRRPSEWQLRLWRTDELIRLWGGLMWRKATGGNRYLPWTQVLTRPLASMKQARSNKY